MHCVTVFVDVLHSIAVNSAVVFRFFRVFKMFLVGLATVVRLCFTSDTVLLID